MDCCDKVTGEWRRNGSGTANSLREQGGSDMTKGAHITSSPWAVDLGRELAMPAEDLVPAHYCARTRPPQRSTSALCRQIQETVRSRLAKNRIVHPGCIIVNA